MHTYPIKFLFGIVLLTLTQSIAQQIPGEVQSTVITIQGATAHLGNGELIANSFITFENGKITAIGQNTNTTSPDTGTVIQATGKHIYPGFIAANSTLGLVEIDAVRASVDQREVGVYNPHIRSIIAYNTESAVVETTRPSGILTAQITPRGGRISGTSSIIQLDAWNWEDAIIKVDDGIHLNWPNIYTSPNWWDTDASGIKVDKKYHERVLNLKKYLEEASAYTSMDTLSKASVTNLPYQAMSKIFSNKQHLFVHVYNEKAILDVLAFAKSAKISKLVIVGGDDAYKVAKQLKEASVPVLLSRTHSLPKTEDMAYDQPYKNAKLLVDAGVLVGLQNSGGMERANTRNLPFQAGTVAAHGLDKEKALQLITGNVAEILGISEQTGTLEVGKDATLFISTGDALDMRTNNLEKAFIQGRAISLESHHTKLYKKYSAKYQKEN